jgi:multiple sugar transport system substrate-binding protein
MANRGYATQLGAEGISRSLDDFLKRSRALPREDLWDAHLQDASWKGQLYAVTHSSGVWVMYYNRELWQQAGMNPDQLPKTWDDLEAASRRVTTAGGGTPEKVGYHPTFGGTGQRFWLVHYRQTGGDFFTKDFQPAFATDERAIRTLTWMKGLVDKQGGWPALEEFRKQASAGATGGIFGSGKLGAIAETHTQIAVLQKAASPVPFSIAPLPLPAGGQQSGWQGGGDLHISKKTKQGDAAWAVIEHLMAPANILQFSLTLSRIPSRKSVGQGKDYLDKSPFHKVFVEMAPSSHNVPSVPGNLELEPIIVKLSDDVMSGQKSIRDALQDAAQQTKVVVEKWKQYLV